MGEIAVQILRTKQGVMLVTITHRGEFVGYPQVPGRLAARRDSRRSNSHATPMFARNMVAEMEIAVQIQRTRLDAMPVSSMLQGTCALLLQVPEKLVVCLKLPRPQRCVQRRAVCCAKLG